jgi:phage baseplate assembly protein gpV
MNNTMGMLTKERFKLKLLVSLFAVSTAWAGEPVTYLDENGQEQTITEYTEIVAASEGSTAGVEISGAPGWYVVKGNVSYENNFAFHARVPYNPKDIKIIDEPKYPNGDDIIVDDPKYPSKEDYTESPAIIENTDVHLILMDGAKLTVVNNASQNETSFNNLTIYAQSTGENMGAFEITSIGNAIDVDDSLIINGGAITANGTGFHNGIHSEKYVVINGGSIKATGFNQGIWGYYLVEINGGVIDASAHEAIRSMVFLVVNDGTIEAHASGDYAYTTGAGLTSDSLKINGGTINASGARGIAAKRKVMIAGGVVNAASYSKEPCTANNKVFGIGSYWSDVILSGGTVTASAEGDNGGISGEFYASTSEFSNTTYGSVGILLAGATVRASSYRGPVVVADGLLYIDDDGNSYDGTLSEEQQNDVAGRTVTPATRITFVEGGSVYEVAWNSGDIPCNPASRGRKFRGWYADKSYQEPFDFSNFSDGAIAYALWEDLVEVTYLDENGNVQSVTPDYELIGNECPDSELFMNGGWVLVSGNVSYENNLAFQARKPYNPKDPIIIVGPKGGDIKGDPYNYPVILENMDVRLILADGAKLTVVNDASERETSFNNLTIYAQSTGENMGAFEITSIGNAIDVDDSLIINGGAITANGTGYHNGIHSEKYVVINGGSIKATGFNQGIWGYYLVEINGGVIDASAHEAIRSMVFLVVNGGTIDAHASGDYAYTTGAGLTSDSLKINGGSVNASGARGIAAKRKVMIAGGVVNASSYSKEPCTANNKVFGIGSYWSDVILSGGTVTASAEGDNGGISGEFYASSTYGSVGISLAGATVQATSYRGPVVISEDLRYSDDEGNSFGGTLSEEQQNAIAGKTLKPAIPVEYIDETGAEQTMYAIVLDGSETNLAPGAYYVSNDVVYDHTLNIDGNVSLVLADGATMSVGTKDSYVKDYGIIGKNISSFAIYGQKKQTGKLYVNGYYFGIYFSQGNILINGGSVTIFGGLIGLTTSGDLFINGGVVTAGGAYGIEVDKGKILINGGSVTMIKGFDKYYGAYAEEDITLGWASASDSIIGSYFSKNGSVKIAEGQKFYDADGNIYEGELSKEQLAAVDGKALHPYIPAIVITEDLEGNKTASLDGDYEIDVPVIIEEDVEVDEVSFNRTFTSGKYATVMFPFDVYADNLIGAKFVDEFSRIDTVRNDMGKIERLKAITTGIWDKPAVAPAEVCDNRVEDCVFSTLLKANQPYIVQLDENHTTLEVRGAVKLVTNAPEFAVRQGDWEFVGVYQYKKWAADDKELLNGRAIYGFVGQAMDGFTIGSFVKGKAGASISPMRAYMRYNPLPGPSMAPRYAVADWNDVASVNELPETITIVRERNDENTDEHTTVIGHFNSRSGGTSLQRSAGRVFDLKGRAYGKDARKARGAYYGKKVVK